MPPQNPLTRIEQVALDLGSLAEQTGDTLGPDAKAALLQWRFEPLGSIRVSQEGGAAVSGDDPQSSSE